MTSLSILVYHNSVIQVTNGIFRTIKFVAEAMFTEKTEAILVAAPSHSFIKSKVVADLIKYLINSIRRVVTVKSIQTPTILAVETINFTKILIKSVV